MKRSHFGIFFLFWLDENPYLTFTANFIVFGYRAESGILLRL